MSIGRHPAMLWATMPEAAVYKHSDAQRFEGEVWLSQNRRNIAAETAEPVANKSRTDSPLDLAAFTTHAGHSPRAFRR